MGNPTSKLHPLANDALLATNNSFTKKMEEKYVNKVILVGNVGVDPEVRTTESGVKVARVRLATTERIYNRQTNENTELTEWHTITLWRGLADVVDK